MQFTYTLTSMLHIWPVGDYKKLEMLLDPKRSRWCIHQTSKSAFGFVWPWPLTLWSPMLLFSCPCSSDHWPRDPQCCSFHALILRTIDLVIPQCCSFHALVPRTINLVIPNVALFMPLFLGPRANWHQNRFVFKILSSLCFYCAVWSAVSLWQINLSNMVFTSLATDERTDRCG